MKLAKNPVFHNKSKHIEIRYHYIRDGQVVDVLTKPLSRVKFEYFNDKLGVVQKDVPL